MKKFNVITLCAVAVMTLSSCSANDNSSIVTVREETTTAEFVENAPETGAYNASTAETDTITVNGVVYRNRFQGDLIFADPQYEKTPVIENGNGRFFRITGTDYDMLYNVNSREIGAPDSLYCRDDEWQELHAYYSNPKNFKYSCIVEQRGSGLKSYALDEIDLVKLKELVAFCEENSYDPMSFGKGNTRSISSAVSDQPKYRFGMNSNDGLFSFGAAEFFIIEDKLALEYYTNMREEKTLIVDVPDELGQYFVSIVKGEK